MSPSLKYVTEVPFHVTSLKGSTNRNIDVNLTSKSNRKKAETRKKKSIYVAHSYLKTGPEVIKLFSCSTQLSMKFFSLINIKMPTIVGILTFMSGKDSILGVYEPEKCCIS